MLLTCSNCNSTNRVPAARLREGPKCGKCKAPITVRAPVTIDSDADFQELVGQSPLPVLIDFWAPWCGPCRMVAPALEALAEERAGRVVIGKVNTDELPEVASRFGIRSIPTMVLFRDGQEAHRESGAMPAAAIVKRFAL
jgi:thioredoxin 2